MASGTNRVAQRAGNLLGLVVLHDKRVAMQRTAGSRRTAVDDDVVTKAIAYRLDNRSQQRGLLHRALCYPPKLPPDGLRCSRAYHYGCARVLEQRFNQSK